MKRGLRIPLLSATTLLLLQGCTSCSDPQATQNLSRLVWMKYTHVANVHEMDAPGPTGILRLTANSGGFWAIFDICTLDVQGSALSSFNYNAANFFVDGGTVSYGPGNPGSVNAGGTNRGSNDPAVTGPAHTALKLSPTTQTFPKALHLLRYRVAVFVKEQPPGYANDTLALKYANHPTTMQNLSPGNPDIRGFYNPQASPAIVSTCP